MNREGLIYTIIFTFLLGLVFVFALGAVELSTREQVRLNVKVAEYAAVLDALGKGAGTGKETPAEVVAEFARLFPGQESKESITYPLKAIIDGNAVVVDRFSGGGLWGTISGVFAVNTEVDRIIGLTVVDQSETPGLGGRVVESWFKDQFRGEKIDTAPFKVVMPQVPGGDKDHENGQIDGIAGATLTSRYMEIIVNKSIKSLRELRDSGGLI